MNKTAAYLLLSGLQRGMTKRAGLGDWFKSYFGDNFGSVVGRRMQEMRDAKVDPATIQHYKESWNNIGPAWYNPLDWFNAGKYGQNHNGLEQWRQRMMDKARNDTYKKSQPAPKNTR